MATHKTLVRDSDDRVLAFGYCDFSAGTGETVYTETMPDGADLSVNKYTRTGVSTYTTEAIVQGCCSFGNLIINGDFQVAQLGTTFNGGTTPANSDDTYLYDQFILLSEGDDKVDFSRSTDVPADKGFQYSIKAVIQADAKWGFFQPIENSNCMVTKDKILTGSIYVKTTTAKLIENIRMAVVSWDGAADTITSDIVNGANWNANGTNPTLVANWTYENTPSNLSVSTTWAKVEVSAYIDTASMTNVGLFFWVDEATSVGDELYFTGVSLGGEKESNGFVFKSYQEVLDSCLRYLHIRKQSENTYAANPYLGQCYSTTKAVFAFAYPVPMRIKPSVSYRAVGDFSITLADLTLNTVTGIAALTAGMHDNEYSYYLDITIGAANLVAGNSTMLCFNNTNADAYLQFDARL
jgi:hypothetical protein